MKKLFFLLFLPSLSPISLLECVYQTLSAFTSPPFSLPPSLYLPKLFHFLFPFLLPYSFCCLGPFLIPFLLAFLSLSFHTVLFCPIALHCLLQIMNIIYSLLSVTPQPSKALICIGFWVNLELDLSGCDWKLKRGCGCMAGLGGGLV